MKNPTVPIWTNHRKTEECRFTWLTERSQFASGKQLRYGVAGRESTWTGDPVSISPASITRQ